MTWQKYIREYLQCLVQLLIGLPVHDESVRDDHLLQIVLIMSGDTEKVQVVALLIISDLEQDKPSIQLSAKNGWNRQSTKMHLITVKPLSPLVPGNTEPLNHLFIPHTRDWCFGGEGGASNTDWKARATCRLSKQAYCTWSTTTPWQVKKLSKIANTRVLSFTCKYEAMSAAVVSSCSVAEKCVRSHAHVLTEREEGL